uniref:CRISPR-associated protein TIGR02710 family n=2 Tax=Candidatus Bipolaricaulota TaxID=67810 RepID=H5SUW0_ACEAU|nr:hypothetical conserved protein [uncultured Acetothermia bacterium]BAL59389.1 CRISPR-associated protein TIGR02710 family [Candidatus Acetothermum autotrophicum]
MRVLLISLGTGPSVEHGIAYSIKHHRPDHVIYFATDQSLSSRTKIEALLSPSAPASEVIRLENGDEPNEIYREACKALGGLQRDGINIIEDVYVDFTSGTKAMSAGLFAAALAYSVRNLIYISGQRDSDGRVISGTERVMTFPPSEIFADHLLHQIVELFNKRLFGAALQLIEDGLREIHVQKLRQALGELHKLCLAYQAWDWFDHSKAMEHFEQIERDVIDHWSRQIGSNKGWVLQIAKELRSEGPITKRYSEKLLIDLWLNVERRMEEEHWIDAVARLYRLVELIAQACLAQKYELDTGALEVDKLPEHVRSKYEQLRDERGRVRLGLKQAYALLEDLKDPLGKHYKNLEGVLQARNESIAGHGLQPVKQEICEKLAGQVRELLDETISDWERQAEKGRFAQIGYNKAHEVHHQSRARSR